MSRTAELLAQLTIEEKVSLCAGADFWHTPPIARLNIPSLKMSDGPAGARGELFSGGPTTVCAPCGIAIGATWDPELVERLGAVLGGQALSKGAQVLLGPTVNMHRHPLNGRHFECYSEDAHLTAELAVAFVAGVQSRRVATAIKHFVANDQERDRRTINSAVDERTLRETYLPPFEAAVLRAASMAIMSAYNRLNGPYCAENDWLLRTLLKEEWGFKGLVVSDWFGAQSTAESARNGLDIEMPGPPLWFGAKLLRAVRAGDVPIAAIDEMAGRVLTVMEWCGILEPGYERAPEQALDLPEDRAVVFEAAVKGTVLLKNEGVLPFAAAAIRSIAVIGPNAEAASIQGGGSASLSPHYVVSPLEGIRARFGASAEVVFERGCSIDKRPPALDGRWVSHEGRPGMFVEYFNGPNPSGPVAASAHATSMRITWMGRVAHGVNADDFSMLARGQFACPESGEWTIALSEGRLLVDGVVALDTAAPPAHAIHRRASVTLGVPFEAGRTYALHVEASVQGLDSFRTFRFGLQPPTPADAMDRAAAAAARCDVAVVVAGTNDEWESEGFDRANLDLPGGQVQLIRRVAAANPRTVVVLNTGAPVVTDWADAVPAILQVWFPGQECGRALAAILCGDEEPGGRLPTTFPTRLEDTPAFENYPGAEGVVRYEEGVFIGYRWYAAKEIGVAFPFGHGLGYTSFTLGPLVSPATATPGETISVRVGVKNTGDRRGSEVVQLYIAPPVGSVDRPARELRAFQRVALAPGESTEVEFTLAPRAFSTWREGLGWHIEPGRYELLVGRSSADLPLRAPLKIT